MNSQKFDDEIESLARLLRGRSVCALTGAGISTESGIPDYRGPSAPARRRAPIQHREFVTEPHMRARFWARSMLGWPRFSSFAPNAAHHALKEWPQVTGLVTQNVDRLHDKAGQRGIELHGALADVVCLTCAARSSRDDLQCTLERENRHALQWQYTLFADGDADIPDALVNDFVVPECACGGTLMPDVVFFGGSVPRPRVDAAFALLDAADALLVVGSSLTVFSGYRFAVRARDRGIPIAIINLGATRADAIADVTLNVNASLALPILQQRAA